LKTISYVDGPRIVCTTSQEGEGAAMSSKKLLDKAAEIATFTIESDEFVRKETGRYIYTDIPIVAGMIKATESFFEEEGIDIGDPTQAATVTVIGKFLLLAAKVGWGDYKPEDVVSSMAASFIHLSTPTILSEDVEKGPA
jgi:hypothetical protein